MSYTQLPASESSSRPAVDCANLAKLVVRRCGGDCSDATHYETAKRFLTQQGYSKAVMLEVTKILRGYLAQRKSRRRVDGGVICSTCRQRYEDHPVDRAAPNLVVLCSGERVIVV